MLKGNKKICFCLFEKILTWTVIYKTVITIYYWKLYIKHKFVIIFTAIEHTSKININQFSKK